MGLTAIPFLALCVTIALGALVGAVFAWPRLAQRGVASVSARVGILVGLNVLVLLAAAVGLNDRYLFYSSWGDLTAGTATAQTTTVIHAGAGSPWAPQPVPRHHPRPASATVAPAPTAPPVKVGQWQVRQFTVTGARSGVTGEVLVMLPGNYFDPSAQQRRYPVIEALHGYPGSPRQWVSSMGLPQALQKQVVAGRVREPIVVIPSIEIPPGRDTECVNGSSSDPQVETWLAEDVPAWVHSSFRVQTGPTSWATLGFSEGGWCAAMMTMRHPQQFGAAVVLGGYFRPDFGSWRPFPPGSSQLARYNLVALARQSPPPVAIWVETARGDYLSYPSTTAILQVARPPLAIEARVLRYGGHLMSIWRGYLPGALTWLGSAVPGFHPEVA